MNTVMSRARFPVGPVVAGHAVAVDECTQSVSGDHHVEARFAQRAHRLGFGAHDELGAERGKGVGPAVFSGSELDDGGPCHRFLRAQAVGHKGEQPVH